MSMFGFYFVRSLLHEAGWPRKRGLFRADGYDTVIVDAVIDQMVDWAAALGAGRPALALQLLAEMFRDRDWHGADAPQIAVFATGAQASWDATPNASPREIIRPIHLAKTFGASISAKDFQDNRLRVALEQTVVEAVLWGLTNPDRFTTWYAAHAERHQSSLSRMRRSGLDVEALPPVTEFFQHSEQIVRDYEHDLGPLPPVPPKLSADARSLGVNIGGS